MRSHFYSRRVVIATFILLSITLSSCKKKISLLESFDRATLLKNEADLVIAPVYLNFNSTSVGLVQAIDSFTSTPNVTNLQLAKNAWGTAVDAWMSVEAFNMGYTKDNNTALQIASFPATFASIESEISGSNTLDLSYIENLAITRKGFSALEYLLFGDGVSTTQLLDLYTTDPSASRRKEYLKSLSRHIQSTSLQAKNSWDKGGSYQSFVSQTQLDISGSLNLMVNSMTEQIEFVRKSKVGKPAGIDNGGIISPSLIEHPLSDFSVRNIEHNIQSWKALFNGNGGVGLANYLVHINAKYNNENLADAINNQLDACLAKAAAISVPLDLAVTQQPAAVSELHLALKKLTVLTKVDMASNLGVVITFSDNDGD